MNINNALPIVISNPNVKPRSLETTERENIRLTRNADQDKESLANQQRESVRVIRVASDGLKVAEFGSKFQNVNNGRSSFAAKPEQQYQANQSLLERQEIGDLVGIDLFA